MTRKETVINYELPCFQAIPALEVWFSEHARSAAVTQRREFRPLPYGFPKPVVTSLRKLVETNPIFAWWKHDRNSFNAAVLQNRALRQTLVALHEIVNDLNRETLTLELQEMLILALTERTAELVILAAPHMPRDISDVVLKKRKRARKSATVGNHETEPQALSIWEQLLVYVEHLKRRYTQHKNTTNNSRQNRNQDTNNSHNDASHLPSLHPLLEKSKHKVGSDRGKHLSNTSISQDTLLEYISNPHRGSYNSAFIITKVYNGYDPSEGLLFTDTHRVRGGVFNSSKASSDCEVRVPLGVLNLAENTEISLPNFSFNANTVRYSEIKQNMVISGVEITDSKGTVLLDSYVLNKCVYIDSLGNFTLDQKHLSEEDKMKIQDIKVILHVTYEMMFRQVTPPQAKLIGPMRHAEKANLYLYPIEIQKFIRTLLYKKRTIKYKPGTKQDMFAKFKENWYIYTRLTQFLGNYWLTYDKVDAPWSEHDPVGFNQTERTLNSKQASCEGCNITLGQLMRFFLDEGEGIAYAAGLVADNENKQRRVAVTEDDYHLKVLYITSDEHYILYDATAWDKATKDTFKEGTRRYKDVKAEWYNHYLPVKAEKQLTEANIHSAEQEIAATWAYLSQAWAGSESYQLTTPVGAYIATPTDDLPGNYMLGDAIIATKQMTIWGRTIPKDVIQSIQVSFPFISVPSKHLVPFLQDARSVPFEVRELWGSPKDVISGIPVDNFRYLEDHLFSPKGPTYTSVYKYLIGKNTAKEKLFSSSPKQRQEIFEKMAMVYKDADKASFQNIHALRFLAEVVSAIATQYREMFKHVFNDREIKSKLSYDVDTFFNSAPFMLLLPNPLNLLTDFFNRSEKFNILGYLTPFTPVKIEAKMSPYIQEWQEECATLLFHIRHILKTAPLTTNKTIAKVDVSSIQLWEQLEHTEVASQTDDSECRYLDPIDTYYYLLEMLTGEDQERENFREIYQKSKEKLENLF